MKYSQPLARRHKKKFNPPRKNNICGLGGIYTMENNSTNTDYHKFVRVGDQKSEIVEITIRIIFFCLRFVFTIFCKGNFQV